MMLFVRRGPRTYFVLQTDSNFALKVIIKTTTYKRTFPSPGSPLPFLSSLRHAVLLEKCLARGTELLGLLSLQLLNTLIISNYTLLTVSPSAICRPFKGRVPKMWSVRRRVVLRIRSLFQSEVVTGLLLGEHSDWGSFVLVSSL